MNTRIKGGIGSTCIYDEEELKTVKIVVQRMNILNSSGFGVPLKRDLGNPEDLNVHVGRDGGQRPIFNRDDIRINEEFEKQIILKDSKQNLEQYISCLLQDKEELEPEKYGISTQKNVCSSFGNRTDNEQNQYYSRSSEGNNTIKETVQEDPIPRNRFKDSRSHSREHKSISTENRGDSLRRSPTSRNTGSSDKKQYRRSRSTSSTRSSRSRSSYKTDRFHKSLRRKSRESSKEYDRSTERHKQYRSSFSTCNENENLRVRPIPSNRSENRKSSSREYRSRTVENHEDSSRRNRSPRSRNISSLKNVEKHHRRSRSSSRTRYFRRRKSPYHESSNRDHVKYTERSRRYSRSPSSSHEGRRYRFRRDSPSPYKDERYKKLSPTHRRRTPSPHRNERYRKSHGRCSPPPYKDEKFKKYSPGEYKREHESFLPIPSPYLGPNCRPQWYSWPHPPRFISPFGPRFIPPRFIPPQGLIRMQHPLFVQMPPLAVRQPLRPPVIHNRNSTSNPTDISATELILTSEEMITSKGVLPENVSDIKLASAENTIISKSICESTTNVIHEISKSK